MPDNSINWGSVADWVSGFGSLSAGIIALYLASASERIFLKGYGGLRVVIGGGMPKPEDNMLDALRELLEEKLSRPTASRM